MNKYLKSESGQSVILISMVILSFIMFFSFVVNTGVLITAKISVQSAADAAAYAGAAAQARQLNAISFLNYDMRQQYKKFVYRYAFLGNIAAPKFPIHPSGMTPGHYGYPKDYHNSHTGPSATVAVKVPVVCIPITGTTVNSDNCVKLNYPDTKAQIDAIFPGGGLTATTQALVQNINAIQNQQSIQCGKTSSANLFVLIEWLMRGDIAPSAIAGTLNQMASTITSASEKQALLDTVSALVDGLGLYPRNIITMMRIETLEQMLNEIAKKDVQKDTVDSLEHSAFPEVHERTIQAFKSALVNLNNEVINHNTVIMQELQNNNQIVINPVKASFNAYVQYMNDPTGNGTICNSAIVPFRAKYAPVGAVKASTTPVHYAVKLTAKAKLLFLPIKEGIELEAFASAKPFGSRIGPANLSEDDFVENIQPNPVGADSINDCNDPVVKCNVPNLKVVGTDSFMSPAYLKALSNISITPQPGGHQSFSWKGMDNATAPQPFEVGHYNIIPPPKSAGEMIYEFIPYATGTSSKIYRFYAPIFTGNGNPNQKISDALDAVFGVTSVSGQTAGNFNGIDMLALKGTLLSEMVNYVTGPLASGSGSEYQETTTFAAVHLPMAPDNPLGAQPNHFWLTTASEVLSSWGPPFARLASTVYDFKPRFGYSVKFVAMQNLNASGKQQQDDDEAKVSH